MAAPFSFNRQRSTSNVIGVQRGPIPARWVLASDEVGTSVRAPHEVRSVTEDMGLQTEAFGALTDAEQSVVRTVSAPRSFAFTAQWRAQHSEDDIRGEADKLRKLAEVDGKLGRPPLVAFQWAHLRIEGWIASMRFEWVDGTFANGFPQAFEVAISVHRATARELERTGQPQAQTKMVRLGAGQTFESVAWDEYSDPDLGIVLRRINSHLPATRYEAPGDVVRVLKPGHALLRATLAPISPMLLGAAVRKKIRDFAEERLDRRGPGLLLLEQELGL